MRAPRSRTLTVKVRGRPRAYMAGFDEGGRPYVGCRTFVLRGYGATQYSGTFWSGYGPGTPLKEMQRRVLSGDLDDPRDAR